MSNLAQVFEAVEILERHNFSKDEAQKLVKSFESVSASKEDLLRTEVALKSEIKEVETSLKKEALLLRQDLVKLENKFLWGLVSGVGIVILAQIILKFF